SNSAPLMDDLVEARLAVEDLIIVVKAGPIERREIIAGQLKAFVTDAKFIAVDLQRFMMRVHGVVDSRRRGPQTDIARLFCTLYGGTITPGYCLRHKEIQNAFRISVQSFETSTRALLGWTVKLTASLMRLEERLETIRDSLSEEASEALEKKLSVSSTLWTSLGGNRAVLSRVHMRLQTIKIVLSYHNNALRYVAAAQEDLLAMDASLSELR
ncbi:hypothetical protein BV25DRAFT_1769885, partial [Artomyces pyxidatus]